MDTYDLSVAFYKRLTALDADTFVTAHPAKLFDPEVDAVNQPWRRGTVMLDDPYTAGFGDGVYSKTEGLYQIDLYMPARADRALRRLKKAADEHVTQFFPANGRGLTLTENATSAHISARPSQRHAGREGAYLREIVEVAFRVDIPPS